MKDDILDIVGSSGPKIIPTNYPQIVCDNCGHNVFRTGIVIYNIPGLEIGNGSDDYQYPVPVYVCDKCGTILKMHREDLGMEQQKEEKSNSSLIL